MRIKIALITGGFTGEAAVSFKSSDFVYSQLDRDKYDVYVITITSDQWFYVHDNGVKYMIDKDDFSIHIEEDTVTFDLAFIMVHGSPGEDGRLQGYFDMIGLKYTSCGTLTSAITMNKGFTKAVLQGIANLYLAKSVELFEIQRDKACTLVKEHLRLPLFVKPNAGGSSIGMSKVTDFDQLQDALDKAFDTENTGGQVIVEEFVSGREFSQGVYRDRQGEVRVLPPTEVRTTREFFDYEAKYTPGLTEEITPADIEGGHLAMIDNILREVYVRLDCRGMVRIDYFLENGSDKFYFIEINTIPGQTAQSFIPQQVRAAGMTEAEFYEELIEAALL